ncbi:uncharacterized protein C8Q71DRAFT_792945 [Rhodofomes roseus]|uniref:MYND-type domain-containing protein n=1 Tax=Rhodofomes roseus TaxID=34475 RepID=A0ABQ8JXU6_9APHY|nr:uncharacterized protein C8Q71DRAFT_792945 [Rhodofomes roseus]KAH9828684.1 hypothetical protein C8Q71DRAFT_792945 [Rhodofomes roseus]
MANQEIARRIHLSTEVAHDGATGYPPGFDCTDELIGYVQLLQGCCCSYYEVNESNDLGRAYSEAFTRLNARSIKEVANGVLAGNAEDVVEFGMRFCTGSGGAEKNVATALSAWEHIVSPSSDMPPLSQPPSRRVLAIAYALQAKVYDDRAFVDITRGRLQISDLLRAAKAANAGAALGLVAPIVLRVAEYVATGPVPFRELPEFVGLEDMWRAWDRRVEEMAREQLVRDRKVARAPNAYRCAMKGCGIEGTKKAALMRCAGKCEGAYKPHYCSKECQKKDWKQHKPNCKPGVPSRAGSPFEDVTTRQDNDASPGRDPWDEHPLPQNPGRERVITVPAPGRPGQSFEIASSTMSSEMLKEVRDEIEKLSLDMGKF